MSIESKIAGWAQRFRSMFDDYTEQRFVAVMTSGFGTWILAWHGKISSETYGTVTVGTVGAFIAARVYEKVKAMQTPKAPPEA